MFCALDWPPGLYSWRKCILLFFIQKVYFSLPQSTSVPYPSFSSCPRIFITFCQLNLMSQMRYWRKICIGLEEGALSHLHLNLTWIWWEAGYYWTQMKTQHGADERWTLWMFQHQIKVGSQFCSFLYSYSWAPWNIITSVYFWSV